MNKINELTHDNLLDIANASFRLEELKESLSTYNTYYMEVNEDYARIINEIKDLESKLKEVGL